jgi:hypothetical protein
MISHLSILRQPWLSYIYDGTKPIESRANLVKCPPFGKIHKDERLYFKQSGNFPVTGTALVKDRKYFTENIPETLRTYQDQIAIDDAYIESKKDAKYLTLIWLTNVESLREPFPFVKHDQRAWIVDVQFKSYSPLEYIQNTNQERKQKETLFDRIIRGQSK